MVLTVEQLGRTNVTGNRLTVALKVTPDTDNYPSGGELLNVAQYVPNPETIHAETSTTGIVPVYNRGTTNGGTDGKLMLFQGDNDAGADGPLAQVVTGNMSSAIIYITVTGGRA